MGIFTRADLQAIRSSAIASTAAYARTFLVTTSAQHIRAPARPHYVDNRGVLESDHYTTRTPMGRLRTALTRLFAQRSTVQALVIGAGQRCTEAELKEAFGHTLQITEASPNYSTNPGVDHILPTAGIDDAELPPDTFDIVWSIYGNLYGTDQQAILQKVVNSLHVGGECFLMWEIRGANHALSTTARCMSAVFRAVGLDLVVTTDEIGLFRAYVWGKKLLPTIDLSRAWQTSALVLKSHAWLSNHQSSLARFAAPDASSHPLDLQTKIRLTTDGPFLPIHSAHLGGLRALPWLHEVAAEMIDAALAIFNVTPRVIAKQLDVKRIEDYFLDDDGPYGGMTNPRLLSLEAGMPLSQLIVHELAHLAAAATGNFPLPYFLPPTRGLGAGVQVRGFL